MFECAIAICVDFVGVTMGDEPLIRFIGTCPWQVPSGERGGPRAGRKGMTT